MTNAGFHVALAVVIRYKMTGVPERVIELAEGKETLQRAVAGLNGQLSQRRTLTVHEACPQRSGYIGATWWRSP